MEIKERKNTTSTALNELQCLIDRLNDQITESDIEKVVSPTFPAECDIAVENYMWVSDADWRIRNGEIALYAWDDRYGYDTGSEVDIRSRVRKMNFRKAIDALESVVKQYNDSVQEKEAEIEKFLQFCAGWKQQETIHD